MLAVTGEHRGFGSKSEVIKVHERPVEAVENAFL